jgi:hypothetical protein
MGYLISIDSAGHNRLGSGYTWRVDVFMRNALEKRARLMRKAYRDIAEVYYVSDYTQKMCEMGMKRFSQYVRTYGNKIL